MILVTEPRSPNPSSDPELTVVDRLRLHLDASAAESLTIDGLRVTEWRDRAGNDIVFTPMVTDTDTRPFYWASGPNGRPVLAFDQSAMESNSPAALSLANHVEGITFFAVAQNMQGGAQNIFRMSTGANPTGIRFVQYRTGGLNAMQVRSVDSGSALTLNGGERISGEWGIDSSVVDFMSGISFLYRDGEEVASGQNIGEPGRSVATDSLVVRVGASTSPSLANTWEGDIAEILFYDRVLSHEERNQVGQYLSDKYNIPYRFILNEAVSYEVIPTVTLRFVAEGDAVYRIEGSRDLSGGWEDLGVELEGLGFGERAFLTIEDEVSREFYRLRKL